MAKFVPALAACFMAKHNDPRLHIVLTLLGIVIVTVNPTVCADFPTGANRSMISMEKVLELTSWFGPLKTPENEKSFLDKVLPVTRMTSIHS